MLIDLCCGTGLSNWPNSEEVVRIDFDRRVKPTNRRRHSLSSHSPRIDNRTCSWGWNPKGVAESFRLLAACYDAFAYLGAKRCTLEQPAGLRDLLGQKLTFRYDKGDLRNATTNFYSNNKSLKRARIPAEIKRFVAGEW
jgi:hypothetical protein